MRWKKAYEKKPINMNVNVKIVDTRTKYAINNIVNSKKKKKKKEPTTETIH